MKAWAQLQLKLYQSLKQEALSFLKKRPKSFLIYEKEFLNDQKKFSDSTHQELTKKINSVDTVFIGDFHTLRQSQRLLLRLLRDKAVRKPEMIGLEILSRSQMPHLRSWLLAPSPKLEKRLKDSLELERWGSNFETYKELFIWAHKNKIDFLPLKTTKNNLKERDRIAGATIAKTKKRIWILFGEYHCARSHLPAVLRRKSPEQKILVIQQNDDEATLKRLPSLPQNKTMVLKAPVQNTIDLFCVLHTPLWIKYQSYLEKHLQTPEDEEFEALDARDQITWSLKTLISFLDDPRYPSKKRKEDILDFNVFGPEDHNFFKTISQFPTSERISVLSQIKSSGVAVISDRRYLYLSELTVNSCAQAAGTYLYLVWSGTKYVNSDFFKRTLIEAMGFFMSKLLNHSRRAVPWKTWRNLSKSPSKKREALAILQGQYFIENRNTKNRWLKKIKPFKSECAVALGRNLSDLAFEAFLAGEFSQSRLIRILKTKIKDEAEAFEILVELKSIGRSFLSTDRKNW